MLSTKWFFTALVPVAALVVGGFASQGFLCGSFCSRSSSQAVAYADDQGSGEGVRAMAMTAASTEGKAQGHCDRSKAHATATTASAEGKEHCDRSKAHATAATATFSDGPMPEHCRRAKAAGTTDCPYEKSMGVTAARVLSQGQPVQVEGKFSASDCSSCPTGSCPVRFTLTASTGETLDVVDNDLARSLGVTVRNQGGKAHLSLTGRKLVVEGKSYLLLENAQPLRS